MDNIVVPCFLTHSVETTQANALKASYPEIGDYVEI